MRRTGRVILLLVILILLTASSALAATVYTARLAVANSGAAFTNVPFTALMSNTTLVTNSFIQANGLDVQVLDGVTSVPAMLATDRTLFVGSIIANGNKVFAYTTGNTPLSSMPIVIGYGGSITTVENAALDLGSNFSITIVGYFNMAASSVNTPIYKQHSIRLYASAANTLRADTLDSSDNPVLSVSVAAVSSGLHTVVIAGAPGGNFSLQVDGGAPSTTPIGSGVPTTTTSWLFDQSNMMPYISSLVIVVGGAEKLRYQPTTIITSLGSTATLIDVDSTQNGVITWGTNPTGISVSIGSLYAVTPVVTPTPPVPSAPAVINGITGGPGPTPTPVSSNFPLYGIFQMMGILLHVDTNVMLNIGLIFIIVAFGIMCLVARLGPLFTGGLYIILYIIFNFFGIADYWMVFMMVTFVFLSWMLPRQTAVL